MRDSSLFVDAGSQFVRLGAMAWILGTVQFFISHVVVELAWTQPYSWAQNNISDLGNVGCGAWGDNGRYVCSPLHAWMNTSFVLQGAFLVAGLVLTPPLGRGRFSARIARALIFMAALGWMAVGLVPADVDENLHSHQYLGLGMGGMERIAVFPVQFWTLLTGIYILRTLSPP